MCPIFAEKGLLEKEEGYRGKVGNLHFVGTEFADEWKGLFCSSFAPYPAISLLSIPSAYFRSTMTNVPLAGYMEGALCSGEAGGNEVVKALTQTKDDARARL